MCSVLSAVMDSGCRPVSSFISVVVTHSVLLCLSQVSVLLYHGPQPERAKVLKHIRRPQGPLNMCPVVVTSFEISMIDRKVLQVFAHPHPKISSDYTYRCWSAECWHSTLEPVAVVLKQAIKSPHQNVHWVRDGWGMLYVLNLSIFILTFSHITVFPQ